MLFQVKPQEEVKEDDHLNDKLSDEPWSWREAFHTQEVPGGYEIESQRYQD